MATILSAGSSTYQIGQRDFETGISQVFLCIYPDLFNDKDIQEKLLNEIINFSHDVEPMKPGDKTFYPGERTLKTKKKNLKEGIPVSKEIWETVLALQTE